MLILYMHPWCCAVKSLWPTSGRTTFCTKFKIGWVTQQDMKGTSNATLWHILILAFWTLLRWSYNFIQWSHTSYLSQLQIHHRYYYLSYCLLLFLWKTYYNYAYVQCIHCNLNVWPHWNIYNWWPTNNISYTTSRYIHKLIFIPNIPIYKQ